MTIDDKESMIIKHLPLIRQVAGQLMAHLPNHWQQDDLEQYGVIGLIDAVERFDEKQGASFKTYAQKRIYGTIIDNIRQETWVPRSTMRKIKNLMSHKNQLQMTLGREPSDLELADFVGITANNVSQLLQNQTQAKVTSLNQSADVGYEETSLLELLADNTNLEEDVVQHDLVDRIKECLAKLPQRDALVLTLYYYEELTLKEIGAVLDISESRVSQLHKRALTKMHDMLSK